MIWLAFADCRRSRGSSCSRRRSGCGSAPSASIRAPPTRSASPSTGSRYAAVILSGILAALGGAYLSIGFVNSFNQNMTAGGVHRARGGHLRQLAAVGRGGGGAPLRLLERSRAAVAGVLGVGGRALPGAPVRAHADRGRRRHRPLDPAGRRWPPLRSSSNGGPPRPGSARASVFVGLLSVARCRSRSSRRARSEQYELMHAGFAIPLGGGLGLLALALARRARLAAGADPRAHREGRGRPGVGRFLGLLGFVLALPRPASRRASTPCSPSETVGCTRRWRTAAATMPASVRDRQQPARGPPPPAHRVRGRSSSGTKIRGSTCARSRTSSFELLPAHTYVKGFLRSYAEYLGLDGQLYVDEYNSRFVVGEEEAPVRARRVPAARRGARPARVEHRGLRARRDRARDGARDRRLAVRRRRGRARARPEDATTAQRRRRSCSRRPATARLELARDARRLVHAASGRAARSASPLPGDARARPAAAVRRQVLWVALDTPQNVLVALNGNRVRLPAAVKAQGVFVTAKKIFAADALDGRDGARHARSIVVTGSELVRGERTDLNGPFLARSAARARRRARADPLVGDDPDGARGGRSPRPWAPRTSCVVSGGLGPTHDDRTVELVAQVAGPAASRRRGARGRRSRASRAWSPSG